MQLNEVDEEILLRCVKEYTDKHGVDALKDVYKLHRQINHELKDSMKDFPISFIYKHILFEEIEEGKYKGVSIAKIAEGEAVSYRTIYRVIHSFLKKKRETNKLLKRLERGAKK